MLTLILMVLIALVAIIGLVAIGCRVKYAMTRKSRIDAYKWEYRTGLHCKQAGH